MPHTLQVTRRPGLPNPGGDELVTPHTAEAASKAEETNTVNHATTRARVLATILAMAMISAPPEADGQYFGQNKVQYKTFDFEVLETEHFDIYYYEAEAGVVDQVARMAERWYDRLSGLLQHELAGRQPLILYSSHPDFRQTNAIPGEIGESTGGVTEAFQRRIVMPMGGPLGDTDHVLGHELVHAFQYDITSQGRSAVGDSFPGALRLPLWFMEGMAEYLSVGARDPHTAMWIRDAMLSDNVPSVEDLYDPEYFPYRFGHAFWAYVASRWGDAAVGDMLRAAGRSGTPETAIQDVLDIEPATLSDDWRAAMRVQYAEALEATLEAGAFGRVIVSDDGGEVQVSPAISPDGRRIAFFSERNLYSIDLFLADVGSGRVLGKITDSAVDPHLENLQFVQSSGTWSPDGGRFAYSAIVNGAPHLKIVDVETMAELQDIPLTELDEVLHPAWSPDGSRIAFSAMSGGVTDLFVVTVGDGGLERLTSGDFSELQPAWSPDGSRIAFVTDRFTSDIANLSFGPHRLAILDLDAGTVAEIAVPPGKAINPQWSPDGGSLYYLGDVGGITNLHAVDLNTGETAAVTNLQTGISGITALSPAMSASADGTIAYTVYRDGAYSLNILESLRQSAGLGSFSRDPGRLPTPDEQVTGVEVYLNNPERGLRTDARLGSRDYSASLSLDYVATPSISVGSSSFGTFAGGGTALYWSDTLGNHNLVTGAELTTDGSHILRDFAGMVGYENREHRWNWGIIGGQSPLRSVGLATGFDVVDGDSVFVERERRFWQIQREVLGTLSYPFNRAQRIEFGGGFQNISFATDEETRVYDPFSGRLVSSTETEVPTPDALRMGIATTALVYDQTVLGPISPFRGQRYRLEISGRAGDLDFATGLVDFRRYFMPIQSLILAGRVLHYGRYGGGAEDSRIRPLFIGENGLVRGYSYDSFGAAECGTSGGCPVVDRLVGSRMTVANLELRIPLFGPLGVLSSNVIPVESALFFDAGTAWSSQSRPEWLGGERQGVTSHGASLRVGLGGIATFQFSFVHPNDRPLQGWDWEFAIAQGF